MTTQEANIRIGDLISLTPFSNQLGLLELHAKLWRARKVSKSMERTILKWESIFRLLEKNGEWCNLKSEYVISLHTGGTSNIRETMLEMIAAQSLAEGILISSLHKT